MPPKISIIGNWIKCCMCGDYHLVNKSTHSNKYVMPLSKEIFDALLMKHTMVTPFPFGMSHCTTFQGCTCLNVSQFKLLKEFHNIFTYDVIIQPRQNIKKKTYFISFYKVKNWNIFALLGNASQFTLGFTRFFSEFGHFYQVKLFNPLLNGYQLLWTMTCFILHYLRLFMAILNYFWLF